MVSDGGPAFISMGFKNFCIKLNANHIVAPPYHPSSNGQAERMVAIVKSWLMKTTDNRSEIWVLQLYYNNAKGKDGKSPAEKLLGRKINMFLDMLKPGEIVEIQEKENQVKYIVNQLVWVRMYGKGKKWEKGAVIENLMSKLCSVVIKNKSVMRHCDQLRKRGK
ncbi:uncharacterized protein LOC135929818 [Gordionus sp. m RMFG-2023]|uniref:uncharacterized protein LOC135929818 n=1 Tax=Gordionus sp. m RMFG-2023 TaxID=3053472 RepID=UPI0031FC543E